ncbi:hypothetical protein [Plebeiibacterium sediminum]|uniref:Uncharacterized protein n=1 Tax=Plebeiibacterium sediminum TaxID=2992112 RepID=A0AAE3M4U7_9BACT|nr:hypothetical protein [Plebeiobacterium sediminum]MCW3787088.1 hypothetical protein [Plebeiobacterium sediminum]
MRVIIIIIVLFNGLFVYSQNDTIYLEKDHLILGNQKFNQKNNTGQKEGRWLLYSLNDNQSITIIDWDSDLWSGTETIIDEYRALEHKEYNGMRTMIVEEVDSSRYFIKATYHIINSKIPGCCYCIKATGEYCKNNKIGTWTYFHENGVVSRKITYEKGLPAQSFNMYRNDKSLMMSFEKLTEGIWNVCRYSEGGQLINEELQNIEGFVSIY